MAEPTISAIAAIGKKHRAICDGDNLLWVIKDDHKRMKDLTMGHTLIMGRKTYESIGRPLPGRVNIIVTTNRNYEPDIPEKYKDVEVRVCYSPEEALNLAKGIEGGKENGEVFVFGGAKIYAQTLSFVNKLYLTIVDSEADEERASAHFPEYEGQFVPTHREDRIWEEKGIPYSWVDFERK